MLMSDNRYQVIVPDLDYYQAQIKCQAACPVRTDARGYVTAIADGDLRSGYRIAREPNPLATICGRVCNAPCETACRRGNFDEPVAIRPLKRVVTERYGAEAQWRLPRLKEELATQTTLPDTLTSHSRTTLQRLAEAPDHKTGQVAVIGSGPAGLGAAHDLALLGHAVTILDAAPTTGGMLRMGIPLYRLDRHLLDLEVGAVLNLGVELRRSTAVGRDIAFTDLRRDFDAIFIATGLGEGRVLRIPGVELDGVLKAVDFLLNVNMGYQVDLGQKVLVIGGGNVAIDAARMALRHQLEQVDLDALSPAEVAQLRAAAREAEAEAETEGSETLHTAFDAARAALRLGVAEVQMIALESWEELPASQLEIEEALEEGIHIHPRRGPNRILGKNGQVSGLETIDVASVFDEDGRFNPKFIPDTEKTMACDTVILAIGQAAQLDFLSETDRVEISPRGLIVADPETGATTAPGIYAGGDVVYGPRILIEAVRDGQRAARGIDAHIQGRDLEVSQTAHWVPRRDHSMPEGWIERPRQKVPTLPLERRIGIAEVETGYHEAEAHAQAERCLNCGINTIFDANKCILCNGCVDVCPWNCLKIVRLADLAGDAHFEAVVEQRYGARPDALVETEVNASAMIKNEDLCTRCGLCARRCPTGAITMEALSFEETLQYVE
jgi:NADPH-dependent glutamate synthase beta subunit-like oxidoreductase